MMKNAPDINGTIEKKRKILMHFNKIIWRTTQKERSRDPTGGFVSRDGRVRVHVCARARVLFRQRG